MGGRSKLYHTILVAYLHTAIFMSRKKKPVCGKRGGNSKRLPKGCDDCFLSQLTYFGSRGRNKGPNLLFAFGGSIPPQKRGRKRNMAGETLLLARLLIKQSGRGRPETRVGSKKTSSSETSSKLWRERCLMNTYVQPTRKISLSRLINGAQRTRRPWLLVVARVAHFPSSHTTGTEQRMVHP